MDELQGWLSPRRYAAGDALAGPGVPGEGLHLLISGRATVIDSAGTSTGQYSPGDAIWPVDPSDEKAQMVTADGSCQTMLLTPDAQCRLKENEERLALEAISILAGRRLRGGRVAYNSLRTYRDDLLPFTGRNPAMIRFTVAMFLISTSLAPSENLWVQDREARIEWLFVGSDQAHTKYSTASEVTVANVDDLEIVWTWEPDEKPLQKYGTRPGPFQTTPVMVGGTLYISTMYTRVVALDAETGKELWTFDPRAYEGGSGRCGPDRIQAPGYRLLERRKCHPQSYFKKSTWSTKKGLDVRIVYRCHISDSNIYCHSPHGGTYENQRDDPPTYQSRNPRSWSSGRHQKKNAAGSN